MITMKELIGSWSLESYSETDLESGQVSYPMGEYPEGLILYTNDGYISAQLGPRGRKHFASDDIYGGSSAEYTDAGRSYIAYSGPFHFDESTGHLEHEMSVSLFPNWQGQSQVRVASIEDGKLHLRTDHAMLFNGKLKIASLFWKRATPLL
jgi:hypothetical protein